MFDVKILNRIKRIIREGKSVNAARQYVNMDDLLAIKDVLEKQIQKKTKLKPTGEYLGDRKLFAHTCPNCSETVYGHCNFCSNCGQALDWDNTKKGD